MIVISSINCYLESIELINIIIEGKLNYAHNHIGLCGIIAEGAVSWMEWGFRLHEVCGLERDFDDYFKFSGEI